MKKVEFFCVSQFWLVTIICLFPFIATSCTKKHEAPFEELTSYYAELGNNHQPGLDCILEDLKNATAIGANSLKYWYNNYDIWAEELQMPELIDKKGIAHKEWFWASLSRMGRMDIIGGITGAAVGAVAGGVGAIPGALAGACYASGNCGVLCLYEHLTE